ncbi:hypothetical protein J4446_02855 [Candidatus Woesearchaeota archaeon]|nr:hypothetical protein [Candidatus Woesearchaeota archaeon]
MKKNEFIAETLIWLHFITMTIFGVVVFFIPLRIWPTRPIWHFSFLFAVMISGLIFGIIYRKKFNIKKAHICFLNLITQRIRGYKFNDPKNYTYSHMAEILQRFGVKISPLLSWVSLVIATALTIINLVLYLS